MKAGGEMSIDPSKLTPAPWELVEVSYEHCQRMPHDFIAANGSSEVSKEELVSFACLARAAFDVLMRRGWTVMRNRFGWVVMFDVDDDPVPSPGPLSPQQDPFTALVEADKWYKETVEAPEKM